MSFLSAIPILGNIIDGIVGHQKGKQAIKAAESAGRVNVLNMASQSTSDWITLMAKGSIKSWKDEYVLILLSYPYILAFTPWSEHAHKGFSELALMPDWYTYLFVTICLASYGIKMTDAVKTLLFKK